MEFGYVFLQGRQGAAGYVKREGRERVLSGRGFQAGKTYAACVFSGEEPRTVGEETADAGGQGRWTAPGEGLLFVHDGSQVVLWEGTEETYLRFQAWLDRQKKEKTETSIPPEVREEPAETVLESKDSYTLRPAGEGENIDALPELIWPRGAMDIKSYFDRYSPCAPFTGPGWRMVRVPSSFPEWPFGVVGYLARDGRVQKRLYAVPGGKNRAKEIPPGYRFRPGQDGYDYWVQEMDVRP